MAQQYPYPLRQRERFKRLTRTEWEVEHGEQPPLFDPTQKKKLWADPTKDGGSRTYLAFDRRKVEKSEDWQKGMVQVRMNAAEATAVNIPGAYVYPTYEVLPTPAVVRAPDGSVQPLNAGHLCSKEEAELLRVELSADAIVRQGINKFEFVWHGEARRLWLIRKGDRLWNAGLLSRNRHRGGVGAPGLWAFPSGRPVFVNAKQVTNNDLDEVLVPITPLAGDEELRISPFGDVMVWQKGTPGGDGGGSAVTLEYLKRIDSKLDQVLLGQMTGG